MTPLWEKLAITACDSQVCSFFLPFSALIYLPNDLGPVQIGLCNSHCCNWVLLCQKTPKCSICAGIVLEILSSDQKYDFQNSEPLMRVRNVFFHKTRKEKAPT